MVWVHLGLSAPPRSPCCGKLRVFLAWSPLAAWSREQARSQTLLPGRKSSGVAGAPGKGSGAFPELHIGPGRVKRTVQLKTGE